MPTAAQRPKLTDKQRAVLDYCRAYYQKNDQLPPTRKIQDHFGKTQTGAMSHMRALERKGYIEHNENGKYRFTRD